ncbi:heme ABC transporter permease, partial [Acinetobacter baumannii]|nr:heme ABC transporter permease [Acinetobacter baumannii]
MSIVPSPISARPRARLFRFAAPPNFVLLAARLVPWLAVLAAVAGVAGLV